MRVGGEEIRIDVNGFHYYVEVRGEGEPLLLLHGFTGSTRTWSSFIPSWEKHYQLVMVDFPGHGKTDTPAEISHYSMEQVLIDLCCILDRLQIDHTHLLGYSMGGRVALAFALTFPERVKSLLLESTSPGLERCEERKKRREQDHRLAEQIEREGMDSFVSYWENIPLFRTQTQLPLALRARLRSERMQHRPLGLANSLRGMGTGAQPSYWSKLQNLTISVLLMVGEWDHKFCQIADAMKKELPYAELVQISQAGHAIHVEQTQVFDKIVMQYLNSQSSLNREGGSTHD
ncbi:2-succinyl-6-hydroxy-2,4-cyclohexadiene-1-carboxylate synthase [Mechercharimyces sp. CAU 1602]|uniref:2-succinyl-6-hydroxy-2, 4-cyclohexadiene-1-carboxylate synthase n=1 Tax=Mechercharimyces sp. CAU 1602 TaxID=2973933 RepID=UPI00216118EA|nr:2-succinyl-6-hydroxy-2,4-cyclohexadiene-1-carboxylate synthase [Mechercharimyces sp. CAU 1602]MCS1351577.1 2-succinyl-6-hydroxy-2,4-cyclohexadiene-1-carboxylate synthase [Mechercharimyces sp. CAU 1602]